MKDSEKVGSVAEGAMIGGRFRVERLIGRGGMGEVYAARHATTGKEVALKRILSTGGAGHEDVRRFMREARAATAIQHPNVIEVYDVFLDADGAPVMVMELLKGEPFSAYRERRGALSLHEIAELLLPAALALAAAHEKGIVHRDLKPDNIFLATTASGRTTKLLDFGIAKVLDPARLGSETQGQETSTGSILGTPHYMSYEQAMSEKQIDSRTDIWAMGVMIFEALTGRRPLAFETLGQMYTSFLQGTVPSIRDFLPDLPDDAVEIIDRCLAKKQGDRLPALGPLIEMLTKYSDASVPGADAGGRVLSFPVAGGGSATATDSPVSSPVRRSAAPRRARVVLVAALTVVAGGGVGVGAFVASRRAPVVGANPVLLPPLSPSALPSRDVPSSAPLEPDEPSVASSVARGSPSVERIVPARSAHTGFAPRASGAASASSTPSGTPATPRRVISDKLPY